MLHQLLGGRTGGSSEDGGLEEFATPGPDGLVFPSGRGTYLQRSNFSRLVWRPAVQQLGLDGLRFHDLRHTSSTTRRQNSAS